MKRHLLAICFDFGDTLVDEATEVKNEWNMTLHAEFIPGADKLLRELHALGYRLAIVSDGPVGNVDRVLADHDLLDLFDSLAISEALGVNKPDPRMFVHALDQLGVDRGEYGRTIMVGNNLGRDVRGANGVGMISVWLDWSPRYARVPGDPSEVPDHTISLPLDLLPLVERLERGHDGPETQEVQ
jgi:HAD superfamily hydrolase (TIGR01549 family)